MNGSKPCCPLGTVAPRLKPRLEGEAAVCFPLTLPLSLGEREQRAERGRKPMAVECSPRREGAHPLPKERAGVRGNGATSPRRRGSRPVPVSVSAARRCCGFSEAKFNVRAECKKRPG